MAATWNVAFDPSHKAGPHRKHMQFAAGCVYKANDPSAEGAYVAFTPPPLPMCDGPAGFERSVRSVGTIGHKVTNEAGGSETVPAWSFPMPAAVEAAKSLLPRQLAAASRRRKGLQ